MNWWSGEVVEGPRTIRRQVPLEEIPLYLREESLLPLGPERAHVGERPADPLTVEAFVTGKAEFTLRSDTGSLALRCHREGGRVSFEASEAAATYALRLHGCARPRMVRADGTPLASVGREPLETVAAGWIWEQDILTVKARARTIQVESVRA